MHRVIVLLVLGAGIGVVGCKSSSTGGGSGASGSGAQDLIVGKWEIVEKEGKSPEGKTLVEFTKDGKVTSTESHGNQSMTIKGTYKFADAENIEMEFENPFADQTKPDPAKKIEVKVEGLKVKLKVSVTKDELTTTNEKGKVSKFKRAN